MSTVKLSKQAAQFLEGVSGKQKRQLEAGLDSLSTTPYGGKPLKGELRGYWSFRVGVYRIIYVIKETEVIVEVLRIQHRKEVYEKLRRL